MARYIEIHYGTGEDSYSFGFDASNIMMMGGGPPSPNGNLDMVNCEQKDLYALFGGSQFVAVTGIMKGQSRVLRLHNAVQVFITDT